MDEHNDMDIAKDAVAEFAKDETARQQSQEGKKKKKDRRPLYYVLLALCAVLIAFQVPKILSLRQENTKPQRIGTTATDSQTDACIDNLWHIVRQLQLGETDIRGYACPLNGKPYLLIHEKGVYSVACPNAEAHGFSHVRVTTAKPIPELVP